MTNYGKKLLTGRWTGHELDMMQHAWNAGVNVPYPVGPRGDGLLMQFVGDAERAAPRLSEARLGPAEIRSAFTQLLDNLRLLVEAGFVHADLSAYNLLWWHDELWLIDFPQAVDVTTNPHALDYLHRDLTNVCGWFARHGEDDRRRRALRRADRDLHGPLNCPTTTQFIVPRMRSGWSMQSSPVMMWSRSSLSPCHCGMQVVGSIVTPNARSAFGEVLRIGDLGGGWCAEDVAVGADGEDFAAVVEADVPAAFVNESVVVSA